MARAKILRLRNSIVVLVLSIYAISGPSYSQDFILESVLHPDRSSTDISRDTGRKPAEVMRFFGLKSGDTVLEVGAGGGYYTELISRVVGEKGYVFAYNPFGFLQFISDELKTRYATGKFSNVGLGLGSLIKLDLKGQSYDAVYFINTYHDIFYDKQSEEAASRPSQAVLAEVGRLLKPGGIIGVVDHLAPNGTPRSAAAGAHRATIDLLKADFESAGFKFVKSSDVLRVSADAGNKPWFSDPALKDKTDRIVMLFRKSS